MNGIKVSTLSQYLIIIGISLRWLLDANDLGIIGSLFIYAAFGLYLISNVNYKLNSTFFIVSTLLTILMTFSLINVWYIHDELTYQFKPYMRYISYFFVFICCYSFKVSTHSIYKCFSVLVFIQFVFCIYQYFFLGLERPYGTLQNNNHVNYILVTYAIVSFFYFKSKVKVIASSAFLLFMSGMGGVISLLSVFSIHALLGLKGKKKVLFGTLIVCLVGFASVVLHDRIDEQMKIVDVQERIESGQSGGDGGSLVWRVVTWSQHLDYLIEKDAILLGLGIDTSSSVSPYSTPVSRFDPHSDYMLLLIDFGAVGLLCVLFLLIVTLFFLYKRRKFSPVYATQFYLMIALMLGGVVGNLLTQSTLMLLIFSLFGTLYREKHFE